MQNIADLSKCVEGAIVSIVVPEQITALRKHPGSAHFLLRSADDALPVHIHVGNQSSYKNLRGRRVVCRAAPKSEKTRSGALRWILALEPLTDSDEAPNAVVRRIGAAEFAVVSM